MSREKMSTTMHTEIRCLMIIKCPAWIPGLNFKCVLQNGNLFNYVKVIFAILLAM